MAFRQTAELACRFTAGLVAAVILLGAHAQAQSDNKVRSGFAAAPIIYVDQLSLRSSDENPGTAAQPVKHIQRGIDLAARYRAQGLAVKVVVRPGIYRESLELTGVDQAGPFLTIQGVHPNSVIISGANDLSGGWTKADNKVYTHRWPFDWHYALNPGHGWPELAPIVRSRAMILVNGNRMNEAAGQVPNQPGTFVVEAGLVTLYPPPNTNVNAAAIEVAARPVLLQAFGRVNSIILRNLVFEYANTGVSYAKAAAVVLSGSNITIEQCDFRLNSWTALTIVGGDHIRIVKSTAQYNGEDGMTLWQVSALLLADDTVEFNNWRGYAGGFTGWDAAGLKALQLKDATIARFASLGNYSDGLWFDTANSNVICQIYISVIILCPGSSWKNPKVRSN